jgi:hypothetical protein
MYVSKSCEHWSGAIPVAGTMVTTIGQKGCGRRQRMLGVGFYSHQ